MNAQPIKFFATWLKTILIVLAIGLGGVPLTAMAAKPAYPVIFIHGLNSSSAAWINFRDLLTNFDNFNDGIAWTFGGSPTALSTSVNPGDFYTINLSSAKGFPAENNLDFYDQGGELAKIIEKVKTANNATKVMLVGHSMGGLAARAYLQSFAIQSGIGRVDYRNDVARLITVGTPHLGSPTPEFCQALALQDGITGLFTRGMFTGICTYASGDPFSVAMEMLKTGSTELNTLNTNIAHSKFGLPLIDYTSIVVNGMFLSAVGIDENGDGIVTETSQNLASLANLPSAISSLHKKISIYIDPISCPHIAVDFLLGERAPIEMHTCETDNVSVQQAILAELQGTPPTVLPAISDARLFAFAEANYSSLFSGTATPGHYQQFDYRFYPASGNYLAVDTSGVIYLLGPITGGALKTVASVESFRSAITAWEANPAITVTPPPTPCTAPKVLTNGVCVTPTPTSPAAPSGLAALTASSYISLAWNDNSSNETGFTVERKTGVSGSWSQIASVGQNYAAYPDYGVSAGVTYYYRVSAYNASGGSGYSNEASATIGSSTPALSITTTSLNPATATVGVGYGAQAAIAATGGQTPYSCSASGLPSGMAMNASTCAVYGTPTVSGAFNVTVTVTDSSNPQNTASKVLTLTVSSAAIAALSITTNAFNPATATVGVGYGAQAAIAATSGTTPYSCSASGLPSGMAMNASTCAIYGTPTVSGTFNVSVTVTDSSNPQKMASKVLTLTVSPAVTAALSITTTAFNPSTATVGVGYGAQAAIAATGGTTPYSCSASGLPSGMAMNSSTCAVYGTPTVSGTFYVTVTVYDSSSPQKTASTVLTLTVVASVSLPAGYVSQGGLTWMPITFQDSWANANAYCTGTTINGQTGWRLPTQPELSALYASGAANGWGLTLRSTWSSTPDGHVGAHLGVDLVIGTGSVGWAYDTVILYVSCVR